MASHGCSLSWGRKHITSADDGSENITESEVTLTKSERDTTKALIPRPFRVFFITKY